MAIVHKVEYLLPGSFFNETETAILAERSPEEAAAKAPKNAYAFTLYDIVEPDFDFDPELFTVAPKAQGRSRRFYLGGTLYTLSEVKALGDQYRILVSNMEGNRWKHVIHCRTGNWQPFESGDTLLETTHA